MRIADVSNSIPRIERQVCLNVLSLFLVVQHSFSTVKSLMIMCASFCVCSSSNMTNASGSLDHVNSLQSCLGKFGGVLHLSNCSIFNWMFKSCWGATCQGLCKTCFLFVFKNLFLGIIMSMTKLGMRDHMINLGHSGRKHHNSDLHNICWGTNRFFTTYTHSQ